MSNSRIWPLLTIFLLWSTQASAISHTADGGVVKSANTSLILTMPASVSGDLMLATFGWFSTSNSITTVPTGWALVPNGHNTVSGNTDISVYWKLASGSEPASYTWVFLASSFTAGQITGWRGVDQVNEFDATATLATGTSSSSAVAAAITTVTDNAMLVTSFGGSQTTQTGPGDETQRANAPFASGVNVAMWSGNKPLTTHGLTSTETMAVSAASSWDAITIALRPAVVVANTGCRDDLLWNGCGGN